MLTFYLNPIIIYKNRKVKYKNKISVKIFTLTEKLYIKERAEMKVKNMNNSSVKTRKLIKNTFIEMLSDKREINKISVSELVARADISRATFYAHFDDIYGVVEEFENELIDKFFTNAKLLTTNDYERFFAEFFAFIRENHENYKMMCRSNDFLFSAKKLSTLATNKFSELCNNDKTIVNREFLELEINIFVEGLLCEYIKYCRGLSSVSMDDLYAYAKMWYKNFLENRRTKR